MALDSIAKLAVIITGDTNPLNTAMRQGGQAVGQFAGSLTVGFASLAAATAAIVAFGRAGIVAAAQMEQTRISFEVMTGSAAKSAALMDELRILSAESPLNLMQIQQAAKVLMAMGEETGLVVDDIKILGNVASGTGQNLTELAQVFGQVLQAGRLTGNELRQFNERGVPLLTNLAEMLGKTKQEIRGMVEAGEIGSDLVVQAFQRMTNEGGLFANMMERQTNTTIGQWEKLKENLTIMATETFGRSSPWIKGFLQLENAGAEAINAWLGVKRSGETGKEAEAIRERLRDEQKLATELRVAEEERLERMEKMQKRADAITKAMRTPGEIFSDTVAELNSLFEAGVLGIEAYQRGAAKAREDLEKAGKVTAKRGPQGVGAVERFTMQGFSAVQQALASTEQKPNRAEVAIERNTKEAAGHLAAVKTLLQHNTGPTFGVTNLN